MFQAEAAAEQTRAPHNNKQLGVRVRGPLVPTAPSLCPQGRSPRGTDICTHVAPAGSDSGGQPNAC